MKPYVRLFNKNNYDILLFIIKSHKLIFPAIGNKEILDYFAFIEAMEKHASRIQTSSVSELSNRLGSSNIESRTSTSIQTNENDTILPSQPMETTTKEEDCRNFDLNKGPQKKAKLLRLERKQNKLLAQGKTQEEINTLMNKNKLQKTGKTLEDLFEEISNCSNKLEVFIFFIYVLIINKILV
jgi:DNA segregation ATPase FtsK/SpoIIIE-like protein